MTTRVRITNPCRSEDGLSMLQTGTTYTLSDAYAMYVIRTFGAVDVDGNAPFTQRDNAFTTQQVAGLQSLVSGAGILGYPGAALPGYCSFGDSNPGRAEDAIQVTAGNLTIDSPGVGRCVLASNINLPAGSRVRLSLANGESPDAYYGEKVVLSRVSASTFTFATGESSHSAASAVAGVCQTLHRPSSQGFGNFVRAYLYGRARYINAGDGASQTSRQLINLPRVLAAYPGIRVVDLQTATNDVDAGVSAATILANIRAMGEIVRAAGAVFVVGLMIPKGSAETDSTKGATVRAVNAGLLADQRAGLCIVPDVYGRLVDATVSHSTSAARAEMMADNSHLTMSGAVAAFKARVPLLDDLFGIDPRVGTPDADLVAGLENLFTWGHFPDTSSITAVLRNAADSADVGTITVALEPNPDGPGNVPVVTATPTAAGDFARLTLPSATSLLTANKRFRERARIGIRSTTAAIRNLTAQHVFTSSYQVDPRLLGPNTLSAGATGAGYPTWDPMTFETVFCTPNSGVTAGSATPQVVVTFGGAGTAVFTVADWRCYDLGAST